MVNNEVVNPKKQFLGQLHHQNSYHAASLADKTNGLQVQ